MQSEQVDYTVEDDGHRLAADHLRWIAPTTVHCSTKWLDIPDMNQPVHISEPTSEGMSDCGACVAWMILNGDYGRLVSSAGEEE